MDIDGKIYCSKCMSEIEGSLCPFCGYDHTKEKNESPELEIGTLLNDRYQLGSVIGKGGFGLTYAAWDETLDIPVAIKEYFPSEFALRNTEESDDVIVSEKDRRQYLLGMQHFLRESRVLAMMKGLNGVVRVQDYFEENETAYIVMEFIRGISLGEYGKKIKPDVKTLLEMLKDPIEALIALHQQGVLHRDITPSNLLVQKDGTVKLIDFGAATQMKRDQSMVIVTQQYAPIEQYQSENSRLGAWTDVYGLSATIYEVLTGIVPQESMARMHKDKLIPISQIGIKIKPHQAKAITQGLIVSPEKRTRSMEEFRSRLYNLPLPEEILIRKKFMRKVSGLAVFAVTGILLAAVNFTKGLPLEKGLLYSLRADGWHLLEGKCVAEQLIVPQTLWGIPVTAVEDYAVAQSAELNSVALPEGIKTVGDYAFAQCKSLRSVYLPDSIQLISDTAFDDCSEYMTLWGSRDSYAEDYCAETGLAFSDREEYVISDNPDGTVSIVSYTGNEEVLALPSVIDEKKVTGLYQEPGGVKEFALPETVKELTLPEYLQEVPESMFFSPIFGEEEYGSFGLAKVVMNDQLETIYNAGFWGCPLKEVDFSDNLEVIDISAFSHCGLSELVLPERVREIGNFAFSGSAVEKAVLPSSVEIWGRDLFASCEMLRDVQIPQNMTEIPAGMFWYCTVLEKITLPEYIKVIQKGAFEHCESLKCIRIPEETHSIEDAAFAGCYELKYIDIPQSVEYIGESAFEDCSSDLIIGGYAGSYAETYAREHQISFEDKGQWSTGIVFVEPGVVQIVDSKEKNLFLPTYDWINDKLVHTVISDTLYAEHENVRFPLFMEKIGDSLFEQDSALKKIELPEHLKVICEEAFVCTSLKEIIIPDSVEIVEEEVFYRCMELKTAYVGEKVRVLKGAFQFCENLEDVYIYGHTTTMDDMAFRNCEKLTIHAPEGSAAQAYAQEHGIIFEVL